MCGKDRHPIPLIDEDVNQIGTELLVQMDPMIQVGSRVSIIWGYHNENLKLVTEKEVSC